MTYASIYALSTLFTAIVVVAVVSTAFWALIYIVSWCVIQVIRPMTKIFYDRNL